MYSQTFQASLVPHQMRLARRLLHSAGHPSAALNKRSQRALAVALVVVARRSLLALYVPPNGRSIRAVDINTAVTSARLVVELPDRRRPAPESFSAATLAPPFDYGIHLLISSSEGRRVNPVASALLARPVHGPAFILPACLYEET